MAYEKERKTAWLISSKRKKRNKKLIYSLNYTKIETQLTET